MVDPELTASTMRLGVFVVISDTNHRPDNRSYRTRACVSGLPPLTDAKNDASVTLSGPSVPSLSKTLNRPFAATNTCVGPAAPLGSGGTCPDSDAWIPVHDVTMICGSRGPALARSVAPPAAGQRPTDGDDGSAPFGAAGMTAPASAGGAGGGG